ITSIICGNGNPSSIVFLSYEQELAQYIHRTNLQQKDDDPNRKIDFYHVINDLGSSLGNQWVANLEKKGVKLSLAHPTILIGKAYVANFNRLFLNNKIVGTTAQGRFELQVFISDIPE
ncbi:MAG: hypothetical protein HY537_12275, partial [Deltaproteobacteria bacterium]|nr:hypothetical protein [Deltaproteobacteria bacterium]